MKEIKLKLLLSHALLAALLFIVICVPNQRATTRDWYAMAVGIAIIEALFLRALSEKNKKKVMGSGPLDIVIFVWLLLIIWELSTAVLNIAHPVLIPAPENVFDTFREQWKQMLINILYSMELLLSGFTLGLVSAVFLGVIVGWISKLRDFVYPIANVMAPIPAVVFSPYLVAIMPSFRSASVAVIVLGVFWPTLLTTINRVNSIEPQILDSARLLCLSNCAMIWKILLPYILPGVISGLKVSVTTSLLMLNYAELMGATHGMGYYVQNSITYANYTHAVAGIVVIGIVVTLLNALVGVLQKNAIKWRY